MSNEHHINKEKKKKKTRIKPRINIKGMKPEILLALIVADSLEEGMRVTSAIAQMLKSLN